MTGLEPPRLDRPPPDRPRLDRPPSDRRGLSRRRRGVAWIVLGSFAAVALVIALMGAVSSRHWRVRASILVNAPPTTVHSILEDLTTFPHWAHWDHSTLSPHFEPSPRTRGMGAELVWHAVDRAGRPAARGQVRIVRSEPGRGVWFETRVDDGPIATAALTLREGPGVTEVTWEDRGTLPPIVGGLFRDAYQRRLRQHLERSLARLEARVEDEALGSPSPANTVRPAP